MVGGGGRKEPLLEALVDGLGAEALRDDIGGHGHQPQGQHEGEGAGHLADQEDARQRRAHDGGEVPRHGHEGQGRDCTRLGREFIAMLLLSGDPGRGCNV